MFKNVYYDRQNSQIHLWEQFNNENLYSVIDWVPYVFIPSKNKTAIKSIDGDYVLKKKFNKYFQYKKFQEENFNIYENHVLPEIQFLVETYHHIKDEEIKSPNLKKFAIDIEVHTESGSFPEPKDADCPIVLISMYDMDLNKIYTFGEKPWNNSTFNENVEYFYYPTEKELLEKFIQFFRTIFPDVVTGWNISYNKKMNVSGFDFPYILNRIKNLFGEEKIKELSPIKEVSFREIEGNFIIDIAGVTLIDYLAAYKWYSRNKPEKWTLDFICKLELNQGKLDYSDYGSLKKLYYENWDLYVDYNIIDVKRIKQLEDKLSFLKLIQNLSLITRCPMKYFQAMTSLLEGKMLTFYRRNGLCAPKMVNYDKEPYPAAYIKEPHKGLHPWIASIDIASSYPTAIITLNMSLETYMGKIISLSENEIIKYTSLREFPEFEMMNYYDKSIKKMKGRKLQIFNLSLEKGYVCISPSGACFTTSKEGVIAHEERSMFQMRKKFKQKMLKSNDKIETLTYDTMQNAYKTLINSFYGILAYPYGNRYVNVHIAEAITACGRHSVKQGEKFVNEILNNPNNKMISIINHLKG